MQIRRRHRLLATRFAARPGVEGSVPAPSQTLYTMSQTITEYHSSISARQPFTPLTRSNIGSGTTTTNYGSSIGMVACSLIAGSTRVVKTVTEVGSSSISGVSSFGQGAASSVRDAREKEKKEISDLNDRLAAYIEKV